MYYEEEREREVDLLDYWKVIVKRKWVIAAFAGALVLFTGIFTFTATPKYKALTSLLIEEESAKVMSIEDEFGYRRQMSDLRFFNTQIKLLKSKSLAERVARKMNLLTREEFGAGKKKGKSFAAGLKNVLTFKWLSSGKKKRGEGAKGGIPENPYAGVVKDMLEAVDVSPVRETKLVEVSYTSQNPVLASQIINSLVEEFISFSVEKRYETTQQASDFLSEQIADLREDLAGKERELQRYGKEKELFFLSDNESTAVSKFADLNAAYTQAQIDRIKAEATYRELSELKVDALPQFVNNKLLEDLKTEYTQMKNEYEEKIKIFKPDYPDMLKLKAKLDSMRVELEAGIQKAVDAAESEYRTTLKKESSLKVLLDSQRRDVSQMNSNAILYNSIKIEVENKRKLLNSLVERQNETLVSARLGGLKTSNITIIDRAEVPRNPVSPRKKVNLILAIVIGLFGGMGLCFVLEYLDNTVKGPEEVERMAGLASLGVIPYLPPEGMRKRKFGRYGKYGGYGGYRGYSYGYGGDGSGEGSEESVDSGDEVGSAASIPEIKEIELVNLLHPKFSISEDYRTVRTSILLSHAESPPKVIVFSSALPKEGKTATVANMAVAFGQLQERVLVVDADMRKPRLHKIFKVKNVGGLSGYLTGKVPFEEAVKKTSVENVWLLPCGAIPPNPSELLNSQKMRTMLEELRKGFDVILLDTPPVLAVIDPVVVASMADSVVFIVQAGKTTEKPFMSAVEELRKAKAKIIGVVFNEVRINRGSGGYYDSRYGRYHGYYRYRGYHSEK